MILLGVGSNLPAPGFASPRETAEAAVMGLPEIGIGVVRRSRWYESEPVPRSDQPWFANAVVEIATDLDPHALLNALLDLEGRFARRRSGPNAARTLDLDLLDYDGRLYSTIALTLPHPRLHQRRFVLVPLAEIAPGWRHPILRGSAAELLAQLPPGQPLRPLGDGHIPRE